MLSEFDSARNSPVDGFPSTPLPQPPSRPETPPIPASGRPVIESDAQPEGYRLLSPGMGGTGLFTPDDLHLLPDHLVDLPGSGSPITSFTPPATPLVTITYRGVVFTCALSSRFRRHTADELEAIRSTAKVHGIRTPLRIYRDTTLELDNCVLDGEGRLTIAAELGLEKVVMLNEPSMTTEAAYELAKVEDRKSVV